MEIIHVLKSLEIKFQAQPLVTVNQIYIMKMALQPLVSINFNPYGENEKWQKENDIRQPLIVKIADNLEPDHLKKMRTLFMEEDLIPLLNLFQKDLK